MFSLLLMPRDAYIVARYGSIYRGPISRPDLYTKLRGDHMSNRVFGLIVLLSVIGVSAATGQVILPPGSQATLTANAAHGGSATNNGNHGLFVLASAYDLNEKTLKAKATV